MRKILFLLVMLSGYCLSAFAQTASETRTASRFNDFQGAYVDSYVTGGAAYVAYDDNSYAYTKKLTSKQSYASLALQSFNFTIPANAVIDNITVTVRRFKSGKASIRDYFATLVKSPTQAGSLMESYGIWWTSPDNYPGTETAVIYFQSGSGNNGGPQLNRSYQWTPAIINDRAFGVRIDVAPPVGSGAVVVYYDQVQITVQYTIPQITTNAKLIRATETKPLPLPRVYPNPFTTNTSIQFTAAATGSAVIELYNISGIKISTLFSGNVVQGQLYNINTRDAQLRKGTYVYVISNGKQKNTGRITKLE